MEPELATLRIAVAQPYTKLGDVEGNLSQVLDLATQAATNGCRLVLFPEVALYGYSVPPEVLAKAEPADGPIAEALLRHADREGIVIAAGVYEREHSDDRVYISHFVAFPDGALVVQRKHGGHEKPGIEKAPFDQKIFEVGGVRCSVVICIDSKKPGILNTLVDLGCQLELVPTAGGGAYKRFYFEDLEDPERYKLYEEAMAASCFPGDGTMRKRYRLRMALATANLATGDDGRDYFQQGHSIIIDSDGALVGLIPGTHVQEHFRPKMVWADIHARTPQRLPDDPD